jgi:hypothetical protein
MNKLDSEEKEILKAFRRSGIACSHGTVGTSPTQKSRPEFPRIFGAKACSPRTVFREEEEF